jgi:hypothetical protein
MALFGSNAAASGDGALQPRLSTLSTMAMAFAILKYVHDSFHQIYVQRSKTANHQQTIQHMDSTCRFNRPCLALWQLCSSPIWIHLLRHMLLLCSRESWRAQRYLANRRRTVPLCIRPLHRTMEKANGEFCDSNFSFQRLASVSRTLTIITILELCSWMGQYRRLACRCNCTGLFRL